MKKTTRIFTGALRACTHFWHKSLALHHRLRALRNDDYYYF